MIQSIDIHLKEKKSTQFYEIKTRKNISSLSISPSSSDYTRTYEIVMHGQQHYVQSLEIVYWSCLQQNYARFKWRQLKFSQILNAIYKIISKLLFYKIIIVNSIIRSNSICHTMSVILFCPKIIELEVSNNFDTRIYSPKVSILKVQYQC